MADGHERQLYRTMPCCLRRRPTLKKPETPAKSSMLPGCARLSHVGQSSASKDSGHARDKIMETGYPKLRHSNSILAQQAQPILEGLLTYELRIRRSSPCAARSTPWKPDTASTLFYNCPLMSDTMYLSFVPTLADARCILA